MKRHKPKDYQGIALPADQIAQIEQTGAKFASSRDRTQTNCAQSGRGNTLHQMQWLAVLSAG